MLEVRDDKFERQLWLQRWLCYYCDKKMTLEEGVEQPFPPHHATRDHYIAESKGGKRIVASCQRCNNIKGDWGAERFKRVVRELLKNPHIDAAWHLEIPGLTSALRRAVFVERMKEKQREEPKWQRQQRINREIRLFLQQIKRLEL